MNYKILTGIAAFIFLILAYLAYTRLGFLNRKDEVLPTLAPQVTYELESSVYKKPSDGGEDYYSIEEFRNYVNTIKDDINQSAASSSISRTDVLFKSMKYYRALASTELNSIDEKKSQVVVASYNGLYDVYKSYKETALKDGVSGYPIASAIPFHLNVVYDGSCYVYQWFYQSKWSSDPEFASIEKRVKDKRLTTMLFIEELYQKNTKTDEYEFNKHRMLNLARIVDYYYKDLDAEMLNTLVTRLQTLAEAQEVGKKRNVSYAYSLEVLSKYNKDIKNRNIDLAYKNALNILDSKTSSPEDYIVFQKYFTNALYAEYLFKRNGEKVNQEIVDLYRKNIKMINDYQSLNLKEMNAVLKLYFTNYKTEEGDWDQLRQRELKIAEQIPELKEFLNKQGAAI